jgi:hypothetical protein
VEELHNALQVKGSLMVDAGFDDDDEDASIDNASDDDGHISHGDSDGEPLVRLGYLPSKTPEKALMWCAAMPDSFFGRHTREWDSHVPCMQSAH